jgi:chromate transporter
MRQLPALVAVFAYLSLLTVGGGMAAFPELKTMTVDIHHWLTFPQLIHFFSVGQLAPGPNMMMVAAIGEWVAGPLGALAVVAAFFVPTACLTLAVGRVWDRLEGRPWRDSIQRGLAPVSIGLLLAGSISIARGAISGWLSGSIAVVVLALLLATRLNPAVLILASALVGLAAHLSVG